MQVNGKQIKSGTIALTALVSGLQSTLLRSDTAVAWTVAQNAGSQRLTSLGAPTAATDAARLQDVPTLGKLYAFVGNVVMP